MRFLLSLSLGALCHAATISIDGAQLAPFDQMWRASVGSGHAGLWQRSDWRDHLRIAASEIGFQYVRGHGVLDNSVLYYDATDAAGKSSNQSAGSYFDAFSAFDYMLSVNIRPLVELSFTPNPVVANWKPQLPNPPECNHFNYFSCEIPPSNLTAYGIIVRKFVAALVERYGLQEMAQWKFEVYNEADLHWPFKTYAALYRAAALAVKAVHKTLKVGGPASVHKDPSCDFLNPRCLSCNTPGAAELGRAAAELHRGDGHTGGFLHDARVPDDVR